MTSKPLLPAAAYLRVSTEDQPHSLAVQRDAIAQYAQKHGFVLMKSYEDMAKSGVTIKGRRALQALLHDVVSESASFAAILVYDVTRWGRFQDADEAAYYEFLCKRAGARVHYCAEDFADDSTARSSILKAVKRTMAGEFSRELGAREYSAKMRLVSMGFRVGGPAGYGLRRMAIGVDGRPRRKLSHGERKPFPDDRVILVHGPKKEVALVREIFAIFVGAKGDLGPSDIARQINRRFIPSECGGLWTPHQVSGILTNPKYVGRLVWGKTSDRLGARLERQPEGRWAVYENAFEPVVDSRTFSQAQVLLEKRSDRKIPQAILIRDLRRLLLKYGCLSEALITAKGRHNVETYRRQFGSMQRAYQLAGFRYPAGRFANAISGRKHISVRNAILSRILSLFPTELTAFRLAGAGRRNNLLLDGKFKLFVWTAKQYRTTLGKVRWNLFPPWHENDGLTLLCPLRPDNADYECLYIFPALNLQCLSYSFGPDDALLRRGTPVSYISELCEIARHVLLTNAVPVPRLDLSNLRASNLFTNGRSRNR